MLSKLHVWKAAIEEDGFTVVPGAYDSREVAKLTTSLDQALAAPSDATFIRSRGGRVYAARNILELWPEAASIWRRAPLSELLSQILGPACGLVRGLYFDKPLDQTWALPWHKDTTIAVRDNQLPSQTFCKPTRKAGVPHVEAPEELLQSMLTLRISLDDVTEANGPMGVIPGSHKFGRAMCFDEAAGRNLLMNKGDVLFIRPLVAHNSIPSAPDCASHRRTIHLEFAGLPELPDGYVWHNFIPVVDHLKP